MKRLLVLAFLLAGCAAADPSASPLPEPVPAASVEPSKQPVGAASAREYDAAIEAWDRTVRRAQWAGVVEAQEDYIATIRTLRFPAGSEKIVEQIIATEIALRDAAIAVTEATTPDRFDQALAKAKELAMASSRQVPTIKQLLRDAA